MIVSFHQISGELGNSSKEVRQVVFQPSVERKRRKKVIGRLRQTFLTPTENQEAQQPVRLASIQDETSAFIIGVFHHVSEKPDFTDKVQRFLGDLCREFSERYQKKQAKLKQDLLDIASENKASKMTREDILREFKQFEAYVESILVLHSLDGV